MNVNMIKQTQAQSISEIYCEWQLRRAYLILMKSLKHSFNVMKCASQVLPGITHHHLSMLSYILERLFRHRKIIFFSHLRVLRNSEQYWHNKGCLIMSAALHKKAGIMLHWGFTSIKLCTHKNRNSAQMSGILMQQFWSKKEERAKRQSLNRFKRVAQGKGINSAWDSRSIPVYKGIILLQSVLSTLCIKSYRSFIDPLSKQKQVRAVSGLRKVELSDTQSIQISAYKTMVFSLLNNREISPAIDPQLLKQQSCKQFIEILQRYYNKLILQSFMAINRYYLRYYDEQVISKLETQLAVLQHQFDSV